MAVAISRSSRWSFDSEPLRGRGAHRQLEFCGLCGVALVERRLPWQHSHILPGGYVVASTSSPGDGSRGVFMRRFIIVIAILGFAHSAHAHGIAGNRFFPGTLSFDDPAVADESILPLFSSSKHPDEGGNVVDNRFTWSFFRLLQRSESVSIVDGFTANGAAPGARTSIQRILRSRARFIGTICMRRWCRRGWPGGSATRALKELAPMHLI